MDYKEHFYKTGGRSLNKSSGPSSSVTLPITSFLQRWSHNFRSMSRALGRTQLNNVRDVCIFRLRYGQCRPGELCVQSVRALRTLCRPLSDKEAHCSLWHLREEPENKLSTWFVTPPGSDPPWADSTIPPVHQVWRMGSLFSHLSGI